MLCWKLLSSFRQNNSRKWHRSRITTTTDVVSDRQFCERHECIGRCLDERVSVWLHVCIARWLEVCGGVALRMHRENNGWMPVSMWHCVCVDRWLGVQLCIVQSMCRHGIPFVSVNGWVCNICVDVAWCLDVCVSGIICIDIWLDVCFSGIIICIAIWLDIMFYRGIMFVSTDGWIYMYTCMSPRGIIFVSVDD